VVKRSRFTTYLCPPAERGDERQSRIQNAKEVCRTCSWNHLVASFVMGSKGDAAPRRRRAVK